MPLAPAEHASLVAWTILLPLLGAAGALLFARSLPRVGRLSPALGLGAAALWALLWVGPAAQSDAALDLSWRSPRHGAEADWLALDRPNASGRRDGRLGADELGAPPPARFDRDGDASLDLVELESAQAARAATWFAVGAPGQPGGAALALRARFSPQRGGALLGVCLLLAAAALSRVEVAGAQPGVAASGLALGLLGACLALAAWSEDLLLALIALELGLVLTLAIRHAGAGGGAALRVGFGSLLTLTLSSSTALLGALEHSSSSPAAWTPWALSFGLLVPILGWPLRRGPSDDAATGCVAAAALWLSAIALLTRALPDGLPLSAPLWALLAVGASARALLRDRVDEALRGGLLALGAGGACAWSVGGGEPAVAATGCALLALSGVVLTSESAAPTLGGYELERWGGLRHLHPRGALALLACACGLLSLPGSALARAGRGLALGLADAGRLTQGSLALAGLATLGVSFLALRVALCALRGMPDVGLRSSSVVPAGPPRGGYAGLCLAPFAIALWGAHFPSLPAPVWRGAALLGGGLLLLVALIAGPAFLSSSWGSLTEPSSPWRGLLRLEVHCEPYHPQRRVVQPLLSLARRCAALEERLFERGLGRLLDGAAALLPPLARAPALPGAPPPAEPHSVDEASLSEPEPSPALGSARDALIQPELLALVALLGGAALILVAS